MAVFKFSGQSEVQRVMLIRSGTKKTQRRKDLKGIKPLTIEEANYAYDQNVIDMKKFNNLMSDHYRLDDLRFDKLLEQIRVKHEYLKTNCLCKFPRARSRSSQMTYKNYLWGWGIEKYSQYAILLAMFPFNCCINHIGDDTGDAFLKTHKADCEVLFPSGEIVRVEIQTGQGDNLADIKKPKIQEAKKQKIDNHIETVLIHLDAVEGFCFIIRGIDCIEGPFEERSGYNELVWDIIKSTMPPQRWCLDPVWRWPLDPVPIWPNLPYPIGV